MSFEGELKEFWDDILPPYVPPPEPEGVWLGLLLESGEEVSGPGYKRVKYTFDFPGPGGSVTFPVAEGNWGTVAQFGLYDAPTGGRLVIPLIPAYSKLNVSTDITVQAHVTIDEV